MYQAKFEPDLSRPWDRLQMRSTSTNVRVNKQEMYGAADVKAYATMLEEVERSKPEPEPEPKYIYTVLTEAPQDWSTSYVTYYQKKAGSENEYELIPAGTGAPVFEQNKYYSRSEA